MLALTIYLLQMKRCRLSSLCLSPNNKSNLTQNWIQCPLTIDLFPETFWKFRKIFNIHVVIPIIFEQNNRQFAKCKLLITLYCSHFCPFMFRYWGLVVTFYTQTLTKISTDSRSLRRAHTSAEYKIRFPWCSRIYEGLNLLLRDSIYPRPLRLCK